MKKKSNLSGFSVAEAILSLLITAVCIEMLIGIFGCLKNANHSKDSINEIAFAYIQLENFLKEEHVEIDLESSNHKTLLLKKKIDKNNKKDQFKIYALEQYKDMIRMTGDQGGHMPLFMNIGHASFSYGEDYFEIQITEKDMRKSKLRFRTDKPIKIEKQNNKNKENKVKNEKKAKNKQT